MSIWNSNFFLFDRVQSTMFVCWNLTLNQFYQKYNPMIEMFDNLHILKIMLCCQLMCLHHSAKDSSKKRRFSCFFANLWINVFRHFFSSLKLQKVERQECSFPSLASKIAEMLVYDFRKNWKQKNTLKGRNGQTKARMVSQYMIRLQKYKI